MVGEETSQWQTGMIFPLLIMRACQVLTLMGDID